MSHKTRKEILATVILENPTYMPDSGMIVNLHRALLKLSANDLSALLIVVREREDFAALNATTYSDVVNVKESDCPFGDGVGEPHETQATL